VPTDCFQSNCVSGFTKFPVVDWVTSMLDLSAYKDDYEAAVKKRVEAKQKGKPLPTPEPEPKNAKVVSIMDALRSSLSQEKKTKETTRRTKTA
jgi:non-homologous end joining protein Ku